MVMLARGGLIRDGHLVMNHYVARGGPSGQLWLLADIYHRSKKTPVLDGSRRISDIFYLKQ